MNPSYARVRFPRGRKVTVNVRDLAPRPQESSVPCQDRRHIRNADTPPGNGGDTDASPEDSSHTNPSSQVHPNVESAPDCLLAILHSLVQLTLRGIHLTMKGMLH